MSSRNSNKNKRNYTRDIKRAFRSSLTDAVIWALLTALFCAVVALCLVLPMGETLSVYRGSMVSAAALAAVFCAAAFVKNAREHRCAKRIDENSFYAVMLTEEQRSQIIKSLCSQGITEHFTLFLVFLCPAAVAMTSLYLYTGDDSCLAVLAPFALIGFFCAIAAQALVPARVASRDGFCTLSPDGIMVGEEILPFSAAAGDVNAVIRFDDYYSIRFERRGLFGLVHKAEFPIACGGSLSKQTEGGDADRLICEELNAAEFYRADGTYKEIRLDEIALFAAKVNDRQQGDTYGEQDDTPAVQEVTPISDKVLAILAAVLLCLLIGAFCCGRFVVDKRPAETPKTDNSWQQYVPQPEPEFEDKLPISAPYLGEDGCYYVNIAGEPLLLVNRDYRLPQDFGGDNEQATAAMNELIAAAKRDGIGIYVISGYRSYSHQKRLFDNKVAEEGENQIWVAPPGGSEHQTGLAFDINQTGRDDTALMGIFEQTEAFAWLSQHAAEHGFILRYTKGGMWATGYGYEPWHYRYVGKELAAIITEKGLPLEELIGLAVREEPAE